MSSRLSDYCRHGMALVFAFMVLLTLSAAPSLCLEVVEIPLSFEPDASGQGLAAALTEVGPLVGTGQLVLELRAVPRGQPQDEGLLVALQVICSESSEETVAFEALDLFLREGEATERRILFDLTAFAAIDPLPCPLAQATLRLLPMDEGVSLVLAGGGSDAKLQVVRF